MGRKSKLTPEQWAEVESRLVAGEARRVLAREFGVSESSIREHFGKDLQTVETVAEQIADAEVRARQAQKNLDKLPPLAQLSAQNRARLKIQMAENLARGLAVGADTYVRSHEMANKLVRDAQQSPEQNVDKLRIANGLLDTANRAVAPLGGKEALLQAALESGEGDGGDDGAPVIYLPSNGR